MSKIYEMETGSTLLLGLVLITCINNICIITEFVVLNINGHFSYQGILASIFQR